MLYTNYTGETLLLRKQLQNGVTTLIIEAVYYTFRTLTIAKTWKQPKCPSTDEWIKMQYIHTMEYYSAIKSNKTVPLAEMRMNLQAVIDSEVRKKKNSDRIINAYMWYLEKWHR